MEGGPTQVMRPVLLQPMTTGMDAVMKIAPMAFTLGALRMGLMV